MGHFSTVHMSICARIASTSSVNNVKWSIFSKPASGLSRRDLLAVSLASVISSFTEIRNSATLLLLMLWDAVSISLVLASNWPLYCSTSDRSVATFSSCSWVIFSRSWPLRSSMMAYRKSNFSPMRLFCSSAFSWMVVQFSSIWVSTACKQLFPATSMSTEFLSSVFCPS
ncbi:hypothetical protein AALO_G00286470 [Alosa alosa]|uniref:Uncharacterized protein n=1 Tax=Alosa alosa TaxID=278164 RepID=A0AAV6FIY4_9TELE|nr:hypothetical protein AALO_G00286470 [Alosa alosa]